MREARLEKSPRRSAGERIEDREDSTVVGEGVVCARASCFRINRISVDSVCELDVEGVSQARGARCMRELL